MRMRSLGSLVPSGDWGADACAGALLLLALAADVCAQCQIGKLTAADALADDRLAGAIAVSGDVAVAGAIHDHDARGAALVFRYHADTQSWQHEAELQPTYAVEEDHFGRAVAAHGDLIIVGKHDGVSFGETGSAVIFRFDPDAQQWIQEAHVVSVTDPEQPTFDQFGSAVAIGGDWAMVGAPRYDDDAGAVYVYHHDAGQWTLSDILIASDSDPDDHFGRTVAIRFNKLIVGAPGDDEDGTDSGAAYVFEQTAGVWTEQQKLRAADGESGADFGRSVAIDEARAIIGAPRRGDSGWNSGAAYIFHFDGDDWNQQAKLLASDGHANVHYGCAVGIHDDEAFAGARWDDEGCGGDNCNTGAVYRYHFDGANWGDQTKLIPADVEAGDEFGDRIAMSTGTAIVAADGPGSVYAFRLEVDPDHWQEVGTLRLSDEAPGDEFGEAVAMHDDLAVVGVHRRKDEPGGAHVYRRTASVSPWQHEALLLPPQVDVPKLRFLGQSVAVANDRVAAAARYLEDDGEDYGRVYLYRFDPDSVAWSFETVLAPSDPEPHDNFGWFDLAIGDGVVLVPDEQDDDHGTDSGSVYVFRHDPDTNQWTEETKLLADDGASIDHFGSAVALDETVAAIGARFDEDEGTMSGSAYVFRYEGNSWTQEAKILPPDGAEGDKFGSSIAIENDLIVVGSVGHDEPTFSCGAAYVYRYQPPDRRDVRVPPWIFEAKLQPDGGSPNEHFGQAVAVDDGRIIVTTTGVLEPGQRSGKAYVFHFDPDSESWQEFAVITHDGGNPEDRFAWSMAASAGSMIAGAFGDDDHGVASGAAYLFTGLDDVDCNGNGVADACDIFNATSDDLNGNGVPDECECPGDFDADGVVDVTDLLALLSHWGPCADPDNCPWDCEFIPDGVVEVDDLLTLFQSWGDCP